MADDPKGSSDRAGSIRIRKHCTFPWREPEKGGRRIVEIGPAHCAPCLAELRELGFLLIQEQPRDP
jgi:hypothetical protein